MNAKSENRMRSLLNLKEDYSIDFSNDDDAEKNESQLVVEKEEDEEEEKEQQKPEEKKDVDSKKDQQQAQQQTQQKDQQLNEVETDDKNDKEDPDENDADSLDTNDSETPAEGPKGPVGKKAATDTAKQNSDNQKATEPPKTSGAGGTGDINVDKAYAQMERAGTAADVVIALYDYLNALKSSAQKAIGSSGK